MVLQGVLKAACQGNNDEETKMTRVALIKLMLYLECRSLLTSGVSLLFIISSRFCKFDISTSRNQAFAVLDS